MQHGTRVVSLLMYGLAATGAFAAGKPAYTDTFPLRDCAFRTTGGNAHFLLQPGRQAYFTNSSCLAQGECDELEELWITVKEQTRSVTVPVGMQRLKIPVRVVEERETADGELAEISRNFYSSCTPANDVYYFGEEVDIYADGALVSHSGAWLAGRNGALPGIIMPDSGFLLGTRYVQEMATGVAQDRAEHVANGLEVTVPAGSFRNCIQVDETSPLEPGHVSTKVYCPGIGLVRDNALELTAIYADD